MRGVWVRIRRPAPTYFFPFARACTSNVHRKYCSHRGLTPDVHPMYIECTLLEALRLVSRAHFNGHDRPQPDVYM